MAKKETAADKLSALIKETSDRQAERAQTIAKLETEKAAAEEKLTAAENKYNKAKADLKAAEMITAKTEMDAAAEVVKMFSEALAKAKRANAFSYEEVTAKYSEFANINNELMAAANRKICEKLAEIDAIVKDADKAATDLEAVFNEINNGTASCGRLTAGQLVHNMRGTCKNTRENFAAYWPKN